MKVQILIASILLFSLSCKSDDKLAIEPLKINTENCGDCPQITIAIPKATDESPISKTINNAIEGEIISLLSFDEEQKINTIDAAIGSFTNSYKELKLRFPDERIGWEAEIDGKITFEDKNIITIALNNYSFTGGAHGYSFNRFLNFDKLEGTKLDNEALFKDLEGFIKLAEKVFRKQEGIPKKEPINSTGFMFNGDEFHLPDTMGYTENGIQLIYNQYEVASYADGPIVLNLPFLEINKFLVYPVVH